jgi:hypothetical protein
MVILPKKHSIKNFNAYCPLFAPTPSRYRLLAIAKEEDSVQCLGKTTKYII